MQILSENVKDYFWKQEIICKPMYKLKKDYIYYFYRTIKYN